MVLFALKSFIFIFLYRFISSFGIAPIAVRLWLIFKFSLEAKLTARPRNS